MNKSDSTPIYSALLYYLKQSNARFHTPAHNGKDMDGLLYSNAIMDITELDFDIKSGYSSIEKAVEQGEKLAEQIYGLSSFFLTDGGSCAVTII